MPVSPWARIKEHKVIQWSLGYLAAALALTHSEELIAHAFDWPEFVSRALIVALALGLPIAITLAWYQGHRASRHVSGGEATIIAILLLIGAGILWLFVRPREALPVPQAHAVPSAAQPGSRTPSASNRPRIAILPFENLSPDPANAFFTDGLHEQIISTLSSRSPDLEVISRTTMMTYRTPKPVQVIARELGATHVLEGSVRREGDAVRLTLQLIDARSDQHLWSQDYDRTLQSALTLQSEVANEVASQLSVQLASRTEALKPLTRDPQAYDLYLKAQLDQAESIHGLSTPLETLRRIEGLLDGALARDPQFAAAYARRYGMRMLRFVYNYDTSGNALRLAKEDLDAAERLAPNDPDVLWSKGHYLTWGERDVDAGLEAFDAADAAGFSDAGLLAVKAESLEMAGRFEEAIQRAQHGRTLDPKNQTASLELILAFVIARRPVDALRVLDFAVNNAVPGTSGFKYYRAQIVWDNTGSESAERELATFPSSPEITSTSNIQSLDLQLTVLRLQHRYREMMDVLDSAHTKVVRADFTLGEYPLAELRGWTHLLLADRTAAARDGHEIADFLTHSKETKWNRAFRHALGAEADAFAGDRQHAIAKARETLELTQWPRDKWLLTPMVAAVFAWAGAEDDATAILERLSTEVPMTISAALIARDPLYVVPLTGNTRYQALKAKLEAQMAATKLE
jgi:TolB-like protein